MVLFLILYYKIIILLLDRNHCFQNDVRDLIHAIAVRVLQEYGDPCWMLKDFDKQLQAAGAEEYQKRILESVLLLSL